LGNKGIHLKREKAPVFWPIHRKEYTWISNPRPGPHPKNSCIPLLIIVRDILCLAKTRKETKKIVSKGLIFVDGKIVRDEKFPAGLMDVISIPELKKNYRILPTKKGLILHAISESEAKFKICRIENKRNLREGKVEVNLHDGRNLMTSVEKINNNEKDIFKTFNSLKINLPDQEILESRELNKGMSTLIIDGKNIGKYGTIKAIDVQPRKKHKNNLITIEDKDGKIYQTILKYSFVVGDNKPLISLPNEEG
jgi:small subunit ribosomal protein S4e